jgi:hypothetical protein
MKRAMTITATEDAIVMRMRVKAVREVAVIVKKVNMVEQTKLLVFVMMTVRAGATDRQCHAHDLDHKSAVLLLDEVGNLLQKMP